MTDLSFSSHRSPVYSTRGMVAASQPLAVAAGLEILSAGGNAADAAVAVAAALNVTEPTSTGLGGDAFALYYDATTKNVSAINGSGRAPRSLSLERLAREGFKDQLPPYHPYNVTVPGACGHVVRPERAVGQAPPLHRSCPGHPPGRGGLPCIPDHLIFLAARSPGATGTGSKRDRAHHRRARTQPRGDLPQLWPGTHSEIHRGGREKSILRGRDR